VLQVGLDLLFLVHFTAFSPVRAMARVGIHEGSTACTSRLGLSVSAEGGLPFGVSDLPPVAPAGLHKGSIPRCPLWLGNRGSVREDSNL
jgi:hypothetical protein